MHRRLLLPLAAAALSLQACVVVVDDSGRAAEGDWAVAGVPADDGLAGRVATALASDASLRERDLEVRTRDGEVRLIGRLHSAGELASAVRLAQTVDGVERVVAEIEVGADD